MSVIGIDWGGKRIGIAVSDSGVLATPHAVIPNDERALDALAAIGEELAVEMWVVGVAKRARSGAGEAKFRRFAGELRQKTCTPVELWDETLSSVEAEERLRQGGRKRREAIDMYAAAVILQSWLDDRARRKS